MDHVVVDVEIATPVNEVEGGWDATDKLGVAVACLWEYSTQRMRVYGPDALSELRGRLLAADRISGYNTWKFDFPVIWGVSREEWMSTAPLREEVASARYRLGLRSDDLLARIWQALGLDSSTFSDAHKGWGLDVVAKATLGVGKTGYGGDAPLWYRQDQVQKVVNYCADDVALERDLSDFIDRYGYVLKDIGYGSCRKVTIPPWKPGQ
jgi:DEAD/DEAH box helicase domain-containing protein